MTPSQLYIFIPPNLGVFFFFNDTATTEIYTLSLHDALPISRVAPVSRERNRSRPRFSSVTTASWEPLDRKSTRLNSSHGYISYAVFCLKKKKIHTLPIVCFHNSKSCRLFYRSFFLRF